MPQSVPQGTPMRAIAYNVLECKGWPSDAERALHVVEKGQIAQRFALELSLYDPDIIAFAESPDQSITDEIARLMGLHVTYFPSGGYWPGDRKSTRLNYSHVAISYADFCLKKKKKE